MLSSCPLLLAPWIYHPPPPPPHTACSASNLRPRFKNASRHPPPKGRMVLNGEGVASGRPGRRRCDPAAHLQEPGFGHYSRAAALTDMESQ